MISKRLLEVSKHVRNNSSIIDVGCDHGLLSIYLYLNRKNIKILATDISERILNTTRENVLKYGLNDAVDVKVSSGLKDIKGTNIDTVIIAGLGGRKIISLLEPDKLENVRTIVLQPNNNVYAVRKYLVSLNYYISNESLVLDRGIIYTTIVFETGRRNYSEKELHFGPVLLKDKNELFIKNLEKEIGHFKSVLKNTAKRNVLKRIKTKLKIINLQKFSKKTV